MKLVRYGTAHLERPGLIDPAGRIRSLFPLLADVTCEMLTSDWLSMLRAIDVERLPLVDGSPRLGVPVAGIRQILAIGLNYRDHAAEAHMNLPDHPLLFMKSIGSLSGATDPITVPVSAEKLDWEIELGVLVGSEARDVPVETALEHVAGYCTAVDVSERAWQLERGGQMGKGKSLDGFTPVGPWLVTPDEVHDPQALDLWLDVNGSAQQRGKTANMVFSVAEIIAHLSQFQTLLPGDLIITGTPAGVAYGIKTPRYLKPGDQIRTGVSGLGEQHHEIVASSQGLDRREA